MAVSGSGRHYTSRDQHVCFIHLQDIYLLVLVSYPDTQLNTLSPQLTIYQ